MIDLAEIARLASGRVEGDDAFQVRIISSLDAAAADSLAFYADSRQESKLRTTSAGAVMLRVEHAGLFAGNKIIVADPYFAYAQISGLFAPGKTASDAAHPNIHPSAIIHASASVHEYASIGAYSIIGARSHIAQGVVIGSHVSVGDDCVLGSDSVVDCAVRLYARTRIGERCTLASGVVIGGGGFGYVENRGRDARHPRDAWLRIEQLGGVRIGDEVDIGANTTIDRGALDDTVIGDGVKLDNQIQIAHNVQIGAHTIMAGCVAIAGSAIIGRRCRLGGRAAILGHLEIADDVHINANSFVANSIPKSGVYSSMLPVQPAARWRKTVAYIHRLEALAEKVKQLSALIQPKPIQSKRTDQSKKRG